MKQNELSPFNTHFKNSIGRGKDNIVCDFTNELVVKWNHDVKEILDSNDHFLRLLYKKKKYEMLKFFLGDFIPETYFVLGNKKDSNKVKIKEYCLQKKIPQVTISSLNEAQKNDPRLLKQIYLLILKLQNLYRLLNKINNVVGINGKLDAKLDLGGLSKFANYNKNDLENNNFDFNNIDSNFMSSNNLLVDPETMNIYCIDFDQGIWNNEKDASYTMLILLAKQNKEIMDIINKK